MKCQRCSAPATVHLTTIENKQKKEVHLCEACAEQQQIVQKQEINLPAILQTFLSPHVSPEINELSKKTCPHCGIKYMELRSAGRLGCPHDYDVFEVGLMPLLKRIHRSVRHTGKRPRRHAARHREIEEVAELRGQLQRAVEEEAYEEAARLRDILREREAAYESG